MRVPWHSLGLRDLLVVHREIETRAARELADELALKLLPRRLALLDVRLPRRPALGELGGRNHDVCRTLADVDPDLVAGLEQRETASYRSFRRGVEDRRAGRRTALPSIADTGQQQQAALHQPIRRQ